ncbi:MAG: hypothetical protein AAGH41_07965 [Pseudomonadota bacterium]
MATLEEHQAELRYAYVGGGPGAIVSGVMWALAATALALKGTAFAFVVLFIGGMLIMPVSLAICIPVFRRPRPSAANPGGRIVIETLPAMLFGLLLAYGFLEINEALVFPIAAMAVGTHYFPFRTSYGDILYWVLGAVMTAIGAIGLFGIAEIPLGTAAVIAIVEIVFGIIITARNLGGPPQ